MMLAIFALLAVFFFTAERLYPIRPQVIYRRGFIPDTLYVPVHFLMRVFLSGTLVVTLAEIGRAVVPGYDGGLMSSQPVWAQSIALILTLDLVFYVLHRLKHRVDWLWRLHETHHSSVDLDFFSSVRFHPLEKVLDRTLYLLPILVLGVGNEALLALATVDVFFGMFIHANVSWRLGSLVYVFASPEMHHWHHAVDPRRRECNYGNNLSIFDWIFGTAYLTRERPREFGVVDLDYPQESFVGQFAYAFRPRAGRSPVPGCGTTSEAVSASAGWSR
jgi:sterol desaturase/sphingolipid hydroxylase (fatty acid hydroxylase superfamily)